MAYDASKIALLRPSHADRYRARPHVFRARGRRERGRISRELHGCNAPNAGNRRLPGVRLHRRPWSGSGPRTTTSGVICIRPRSAATSTSHLSTTTAVTGEINRFNNGSPRRSRTPPPSLNPSATDGFACVAFPDANGHAYGGECTSASVKFRMELQCRVAWRPPARAEARRGRVGVRANGDRRVQHRADAPWKSATTSSSSLTRARSARLMRLPGRVAPAYDHRRDEQ